MFMWLFEIFQLCDIDVHLLPLTTGTIKGYKGKGRTSLHGSTLPPVGKRNDFTTRAKYSIFWWLHISDMDYKNF